jgi:hypothetical protein
MAQLVGQTCNVCGRRIESIREGDYCDFCGNPVHLKCREKKADDPGPDHCDYCGADVNSEAGQKNRQDWQGRQEARHRAETEKILQREREKGFMRGSILGLLWQLGLVSLVVAVAGVITLFNPPKHLSGNLEIVWMIIVSSLSFGIGLLYLRARLRHRWNDQTGQNERR